MLIVYRKLGRNSRGLFAYPRSLISFGSLGWQPDIAAVPYFRMVLPIPLWCRSVQIGSATAPWNPREWRLLSLNWNGISGWFFAPRWRKSAPKYAAKYYDDAGRRFGAR